MLTMITNYIFFIRTLLKTEILIIPNNISIISQYGTAIWIIQITDVNFTIWENGCAMFIINVTDSVFNGFYLITGITDFIYEIV